LRKGVKFHDGKELTAHDVKYTFDRALDPETAAGMVRYILTVEGAEVIDDYTVKLMLKQFDPAILGACASGRVVSIIPEGAADRMNLAIEGIGTGPFKLEEYVANSHYTFAKHQDYWDQPLPYLEQLSFKIMPDEDTRIAALRTGAVDYAPISAEGAVRLVGEPGISVLKGPRAWCAYFYINTSREPWNDLRVRQAVNLAIDRAEIIEKAVGGAGAPTGPIPPGYGDYAIPEASLPWEYNVDKAKQLLADAGYPDGFKTELKCSPQYPEMVSSSVVFAEQMKKLNIDVEIVQMEWAQLVKETKDPLWDFDLRTGAFTWRHDPSQYLVYFRTDGSALNPGYSNPKVDELYDASIATADIAKRLPIYRELQEELMEDLPMFWLYGRVNFEAIRDYVKGYIQLFSGNRTFFKSTWVEK
jgi:peptide/nickel transport system substrate-binding protein